MTAHTHEEAELLYARIESQAARIDALVSDLAAANATIADLEASRERLVRECKELAERAEAKLAATNTILDEVRGLWPDIRQLQDGFMNGDPNFSEWDHSVRDRCIAMSFKLEGTR